MKLDNPFRARYCEARLKRHWKRMHSLCANSHYCKEYVIFILNFAHSRRQKRRIPLKIVTRGHAQSIHNIHRGMDYELGVLCMNKMNHGL